MSNGYATVSGTRVDYLLRMPDYEVPAGRNPATLLDRISFSSGFETAKRTEGECHRDASESLYLCAGTYVFSKPVEKLGVDCRFFEVTVPNHIHMLHAELAGKSDQAILDSAFPSATLLFRPPTAIEQAFFQAAAAARRTLTTWAQLLLLLAIALASRTWRELLVCILAFVTAECAACLAAPSLAWQPSPRFSESFAALGLAYLGFEMLVFPLSRGRWLVASVFGVFSGLYYSTFISESAYLAGWVLAGSGTAAAAALALSGVSLRLPNRQLIAKISSVPLLLAGAIWFVVRLHE